MLGPIKNSLSVSEVNNSKSPRSTKEKVEVQADFLRKKIVTQREFSYNVLYILGTTQVQVQVSWDLWAAVQGTYEDCFRILNLNDLSRQSILMEASHQLFVDNGEISVFDPLHARHTQ